MTRPMILVVTSDELEGSIGHRGDVPRRLALLLLVGGSIGLVASFQLTVDKIELLRDSDATFSCNLNAFVSCSGVMGSPQAEVFGFPNSIIGIAGFSVVVTLGVLSLLGTRLPERVWGGLQLGVIFGVSFVTWLQYQSVFKIGKLCPYCMAVWIVMIPMFVCVTARNARAAAPESKGAALLNDWALLVVLLWLVLIGSAIWFQFGSSLWA